MKVMKEKKHILQMVKHIISRHLNHDIEKKHIKHTHNSHAKGIWSSFKLSGGHFVICKSGGPKCAFSMTPCHQLLLPNLTQTLGKRTLVTVTKNLSGGVIPFAGKGWQRQIISQSGKGKGKWEALQNGRWRIIALPVTWYSLWNQSWT